MTSQVIQVKDVSKLFVEKRAVQNISLDIHQGEVVSILGPNGSGKSTTINMMLGILKPTQGVILLKGKNPRNYRNRQCLGAMLQHIGLPDTLRSLELVELWRSFYQAPLPKQEVIEMAGLSEITNARFGELSGGQKRRVAFALAICGNPELLFLDEPSAGLDVDSRNLLWAQIKNFASLKKTVVLCTHYLEEADALSNRIVLMNAGEIIANDSPQNIKSKVGRKTIRFKSCLPLPVFKGIPTVENVATHLGHVSLETKSPELVLRSIFTMDDSISDLEVISVNLENALLALTKR